MLKAKQQLEIYNKQIQELKEILQQKNLQVMEFATKPIKIDKDTQVTVKGLRFITEEKKDVCVCPYILLNREGLKDGKYYEADKDNLYFYEIGLKTGPDIKLVKITVIDTSDYGDDYEQQLSTLYPYVEQALKEIEEGPSQSFWNPVRLKQITKVGETVANGDFLDDTRSNRDK